MAETDDGHAEEINLQPLDDDCRLLGSLLDTCLKHEIGDELFHKVEKIRAISQCAATLSLKGAASLSVNLSQNLADELMAMNIDEALPLTRACGHYLHLTGIAELQHRLRSKRLTPKRESSCDEVFGRLLSEGLSSDKLYDAIVNQVVEIVLTAHPTQVNRRTLQYKLTKVSNLLQQNDRVDLTKDERDTVLEDLMREVMGLWQTDELRRQAPTPLDEARSGLHLVEQSLWTAVPQFMRLVSKALKTNTGRDLPLQANIFKFSSWMGGDRDGNPNVTSSVTSHVVLLARSMAADLYLKEIEALHVELSMSKCSPEAWHLAQSIMSRAEAAIPGKPAAAVPPPPSPVKGRTSATGQSPFITDKGQRAHLLVERSPSVKREMLVPALAPLPEMEGFAEDNDLVQAVASIMDVNRAASIGIVDPTPLRKSLLKHHMSMNHATFRKQYEHPGVHPYRTILEEVREKLQNTQRYLKDLLDGHEPTILLEDTIQEKEEIEEPLRVIYWSLYECGAGTVADGRLIDLLRRLSTFGLSLLKLDIRQESTRHAETVDAITTYLGMGSYLEWSEDQRIEFLTKELQGRRPLVPSDMPMTPEVKEVMDTFKVVAQLGRNNLGTYVISMAKQASDVLAVELLQREAALQVAAQKGTSPDLMGTLRVAPLFEMLEDLHNGPGVMVKLLANPWYRSHVRMAHDNHQEVMLGYSDSGKDAGRMAANWALYRCQEDLVQVFKDAGIKFTLFHGRGGTVGRGGGPTHVAIQSQPPGSVAGSFRITEQGEMVQAKFGIPAVAQDTMEVYTTAVLLATVHPPNPPKYDNWRQIMDTLGKSSCDAYRSVVTDPLFISYFQHATPEAELGGLNIGSRPARRRANISGISTLRAIPWVFAWTQTRLILPSWLGIGEALEEAVQKGQHNELRKMYMEWPFFQATIDLIEMILAKCDEGIASLYDEVLVQSPEEKQLGAMLRTKLRGTIKAILSITGHPHLLANNANLKRLLEMRNPYIEPLNILQVEIIRRLRQDPDNLKLKDAMLISINGIAAGMRNTG